jgi:hypothetical protein
MAAAITDALPAPKNFFNSYSNHGGRPSIDRATEATIGLLAIAEGPSVLPWDPVWKATGGSTRSLICCTAHKKVGAWRKPIGDEWSPSRDE